MRHQEADTYSHPELIAASVGEVETARGDLGEELEQGAYRSKEAGERRNWK